PEQFSKLRLERLFAHVLAAAGGRVALTFIGVTGAMIIDIALLLDLADHRAAALLARNHAREGKVAPAAPSIIREASINHVLNALPQFDRHQGLVLALDQLAVPLEPAGIE